MLWKNMGCNVKTMQKNTGLVCSWCHSGFMLGLWAQTHSPAARLKSPQFTVEDCKTRSAVFSRSVLHTIFVRLSFFSLSAQLVFGVWSKLILLSSVLASVPTSVFSPSCQRVSSRSIFSPRGASCGSGGGGADLARSNPRWDSARPQNPLIAWAAPQRGAGWTRCWWSHKNGG